MRHDPAGDSARIAASVLICFLAEGCHADSPASAAAAPPSAPISADAATQPEAAEQKVQIDNFSYTPASITVSAGTKVTWVNHDDVPHTVTSTTKPRVLKSPALDTDDKYSYVFDKPGTYTYFCTVHPHMTGQVIVK
jgi:plastocyanin